MDPLWKEDAERSRVGKPRRILMVKPLRASVVPMRPEDVERAAAQQREAALAQARGASAGRRGL